jgi:cytochrome c biogenesis protein CcmG, thiol:disulfide interchange protein DsbE
MTETVPTPTTPAKRGPRLILFLPVAIFAALAGLFLLRLETGGDSSSIPSALIGKAAPDFVLPPLEGTDLPGLTHASLLGNLSVVNVFGSWCGPCRYEHPQLTELAKDSRIRLVGINYKDRPEDALRFLAELGNPYQAIGADVKGRTTIDWGGYGVPETFIVSPKGVVLYKFIGPITPDALTDVVKPQIEKALAPKG